MREAALAIRAFQKMHQVGRPEGRPALADSLRGWNVLGHPDSWYLVLRSEDLPVGAVRSVRVCGRNLVLFRGHSGSVGAIERFCSHLGADLEDGLVVEDFLRCPFHQLLWDGHGGARNAETLESAADLKSMTAYPVIERNHSMHVWISSTGAAPTWEPPQFESDLVQLSREKVSIGCHLAVESMACYDREHGRHAHAQLFKSLNIRTESSFWQAGPDPDRPHVLSVRVELRHLRYPMRLRAYSSFYGPGICSSHVEVALGGSRDFTPLGGRSYTGFIPSDPSTHIADSAVYVRSSAPFWHSYIMIGITFWVHSLIQTEDMEVWNRQSYRPGGTYYDEFWNWYQQFQSPISDPENQPLA